MRYFIKKIIPILIILLICGLLFFGFRYATENLKSCVSRFSEQNFNVKVSIGNVGFGLPFCVELKDVQINDSIDIRKLSFYPIVSIVKVIDPVVIIRKAENGQFSMPELTGLNFYFSKMRVENGTLIYDEGKENMLEFVRIKGIIECPGFAPLKDNAFRFVATGFLKNKDSDFLSPLKIKGRMYSDRIIRAKLNATDIKLDTLSSLYAKYLDSVMKNARIDFDGIVQVSKSNLIAKCFLEGKDIILNKGLSGGRSSPLSVSFILLANFKSKLVEIKHLQGNFLELIFSS